ncbi:MAG: TonB-dependent receptor [Pirellulaceae bacterium]|nr:TonB-dependent receptor [Pirellulaceae bacterium]
MVVKTVNGMWQPLVCFVIFIVYASFLNANDATLDSSTDASKNEQVEVSFRTAEHVYLTDQDKDESHNSSDGLVKFLGQDNSAENDNDRVPVVQASMLQPTPLLEPRITANFDTEGARTNASATSRPATVGTRAATAIGTAGSFGSRDVVSGAEALPQASTDLGNLLRKSSSALSVGVQARTPIVNDPRIRGARIGSLAASGSHWVPARVDLDTILSKFDSRQVESVTITPGPFTSLFGPGFAFTDIQLLRSPRFQNGFESHGSTGAEYRANGSQFLGQQSALLGNANWGGRFSYVTRSGGDYKAGGGLSIPSSYQSNEMTLALGRDWTNDTVELNVLRLDQTNVVFPGYVFDLNYLVTDGYEVTHTHSNMGFWDALETEVWYNRTRFNGNAQNPRKRPFFPTLDLISYTGFTDVDSMSTGYRQKFVLGGGDREAYKFSMGHDLRFIKQELNEISSGTSLGLPIPFSNRNSPIPESYQANPGLFVEYEESINESLTVKSGARIDYAGTDITDDAQKLASVGLDINPASYAEIVGTNRYKRDFTLLSAFMSAKQSYSDELTNSISLGFAERPPTLTELYAAQPFMLLLQNGLNNVTGDPTLKNEKLLQLDVSWEYRTTPVRTGMRAFHAWGFDYITFENTSVQYVPPVGNVGQVSLRYVNTDLATLAGFEYFADLFPESPLTPFFNTRYVDGRDRTRNGRFATTEGSQGNPSQKILGQVRGLFSGIAGNSSEPLPGISPLDTRIGLRYHDTSPANRWQFELSSRIVNQQKRIATSLLETQTASFVTCDMRASFRPLFNDHLLIATGVENFLDRRYREHLDFRTQNGLSIFQPGANFYVSANLTY